MHSILAMDSQVVRTFIVLNPAVMFEIISLLIRVKGNKNVYSAQVCYEGHHSIRLSQHGYSASLLSVISSDMIRKAEQEPI